MSDRYVRALIYGVRDGPSVRWDKAQPTKFSMEDFDVEIGDGKATFKFKTKDFETEAVALEAVGDFISKWEVSAALDFGPDAYRLEFKMPQFEEQNPVPGQVRLMGGVRVRIEGGGNLTVVSHPPNYPTPPFQASDIKLTPNVRSMLERFVDCLRGNERLDSMAYFCLTVLEMTASQEPGEGMGRTKAAKVYGVSRSVLDRIASLSSNYGRKAEGEGRPLNDDECSFLKKATSTIIRRVAEQEHDPAKALPKITLADFHT